MIRKKTQILNQQLELNQNINRNQSLHPHLDPDPDPDPNRDQNLIIFLMQSYHKKIKLLQSHSKIM